MLAAYALAAAFGAEWFARFPLVGRGGRSEATGLAWLASALLLAAFVQGLVFDRMIATRFLPGVAALRHDCA